MLETSRIYFRNKLTSLEYISLKVYSIKAALNVINLSSYIGLKNPISLVFYRFKYLFVKPNSLGLGGFNRPNKPNRL